jgi:predicted dithiol-disulfide oxidoreductase (DUF899 family)
MAEHAVVSHDEWLAARKEHLAAEKEFTRARDRLSQARRDLPWEAVDKNYVFEGPTGQVTLDELFDGRRQLVIYHAMWNPATATPQTSWTADAACPLCSWWLDNLDEVVVHLKQKNVTLIAVSRAPYATLVAYKKRMGWKFTWVSSGDTDFNFDLGVSFTPEQLAAKTTEYNYGGQHSWQTEAPGITVFVKDDDGKICHSYSAYARGLDMLNVAYHYLDLVPMGRDEADTGPFWVRRHDEY